jgi:hypothetical protein
MNDESDLFMSSRIHADGRCPADPSTIVPSSGPFLGHRVPRLRSVVMSTWLGGDGGRLRDLPAYFALPPGLSSPPWRLYLKQADVSNPAPSGTLVLLDERPDTINWGGSMSI